MPVTVLTASAALTPASLEERVFIGFNNPIEGIYSVVADGVNDLAGENLHITATSENGYGGGWASSLATAGNPPTANGDVSIKAGEFYSEQLADLPLHLLPGGPM